MSRCLSWCPRRQPSVRDDGRQAREGGRLLGRDPSATSSCGTGNSPRRPSAAGAAFRRRRGSRSRDGRDRPEARHGEPPGDPFVGLPVDDLLERRQPAGHALRRGSHAAAPARRRLFDDDRALPRRPECRRGEIRPDDRRLGGKRGLDVKDHIACGDLECDALPSRPATGPRGRACRYHPTEMLDRFLALPEARGTSGSRPRASMASDVNSA